MYYQAMGQADLIEIIGKLAGTFIPFLFALSFHEFAHAWVAKRRGDNTAEHLGRLTLNPFSHADLIGTFVLPIMGILSGWAMFGWAKPVPVNPRNLKDPKNDMFWVAAAGPLSNILLAFLGGILLVVLSRTMQASETAMALGEMLTFFIFINILLALFNLIPLHPLDGGKILERFIPASANRWLEENQMTLNIILIGLFITGGLHFLAEPARQFVRMFLQFAS